MPYKQLKIDMEFEKKLPKILSKDFLRRIFSIDENGTPCSHYLMKKQFDVNFLVHELKITIEEFRIRKGFSVLETKKIYAHFDITIHDVLDM